MISKKVYIVLAITFVTLMIWVVMDIIHARQDVTIPKETQDLLTPVNPNFDQGVIDGL